MEVKEGHVKKKKKPHCVTSKGSHLLEVNTFTIKKNKENNLKFKESLKAGNQIKATSLAHSPSSVETRALKKN